jgi:hypothetical protein
MRRAPVAKTRIKFIEVVGLFATWPPLDSSNPRPWDADSTARNTNSGFKRLFRAPRQRRQHSPMLLHQPLLQRHFRRLGP